MSSYSVMDLPYVGSLLAVNLFSGSTTMLLNVFNGSSSTTLVDDGTRLYVGETVKLGGVDYQYLGSGSAQPGINVFGITIPTGFPKDLILLKNASTGQMHFVFPQGMPNALGMIALVVKVDEIGYDMNSNAPLCFAEGTLIDTVEGRVPVEELQPGAELRSADGPALRLLANIKTDLTRVSPAAGLPVVIAKDAFQPGCPDRDLVVSQQHGIALSGAWLELLYGVPEALVPAIGLLDFAQVTIGHDRPRPHYRHLLCDRHGIIWANGVASETLLWCKTSAAMIDPDQTRGLADTLRYGQSCLPRLTAAEARTLLRQGKAALTQVMPLPQMAG